MRRLLPVLLLLALLLPNGAAWAHAVLLASSPAADSALPQSPAAIDITFNEPIQLLALRLMDSTGSDVTPATPPAVTEGQVSWALPAAPRSALGPDLLPELLKDAQRVVLRALPRLGRAVVRHGNRAALTKAAIELLRDEGAHLRVMPATARFAQPTIRDPGSRR